MNLDGVPEDFSANTVEPKLHVFGVKSRMVSLIESKLDTPYVLLVKGGRLG